MNASKLLISSAAAMAVVGAIGFANAQSTDPSTATSPAATQQLDQAAPRPADQTGTSSDATMNNSGSSTMQSDSGITDLAAQADRN